MKQVYFINPYGQPSGRAMKKRKKGKLSGAAKKAFLARMAKGRRAASPARKRAKKSTSTASVPVATKKRAKSKKKGRRRTARARRNPPSFGRMLTSGRGIVGQVMQGAQDAAAVVAGKAVTNVIARMVPVTSTAPALAVRTAIAVAAGIAARAFLGADVGRMVLAGGLTVPIETVVRSANVPMITGALSSDEDITRLLRAGMGAYPLSGHEHRRVSPGSGVGSYPLGDGSTQSMMNGNFTSGNSYF